MGLSLMFLPLMHVPFDGTAQRPPKRCSSVQIVSASHSSDKKKPITCTATSARSVPGQLAHAYARQIEIVPATFYFDLT
jgi:hypothetical protein